MRIHTDYLTGNDLRRVLRETVPAGVWLDRCTLHGSRSRGQAFDVALEAERDATHTRKRNSGTGSNYDMGYAATYDEWGHWLAALFELDPDAIADSYKGRDDFHAQTKNAYKVAVDA